MVPGGAGSSRGVMVPGGVVVPSGAGVDVPAIARAVETAAPGVLVALGEVAPGIDGFRSSREQADRARRVAQLAGRRAPAVVCYADVALVDLLSRDVEAARLFVRAELGELAGGEEATAALRETLLAVIAPGGGGVAGASRALGLHRNTVLQRVHRAEGLRGRGVAERPGELHAALLLAAALGPAVLTPGP
jgi:DNA-binding PucR family transcriptional regulator